MIREKIEQVETYVSQGLTYKEIANLMNISVFTVKTYRNTKTREKLLENEINKENNIREKEEYICELISKYNNFNQVCKILNKRATNTNYTYLKKIVEKYKLDISHFSKEFIPQRVKKILTKDEIFQKEGCNISTSQLKEKIWKFNLKEHKCERCGLTEWEGELIPLQVHHINGNNKDNRIENLQILCPNCHALTDTYCGRNKKTIKKQKHESKTPIVSKEDLIKDLKQFKNFSAVGKMHNVSDNAIRKWCVKYHLPTHTKDLKML